MRWQGALGLWPSAADPDGGADAGDRARRAGAGHQGRGPAYAGGWWDWLTPFCILTGVARRGRLCAARRDLADLKTTGDLRTCAALRRYAGVGDARADRRREPVDPVHQRRSISSAGSPGRQRSFRVACRCCWRCCPGRCGEGLARGRDLQPFLAALGLFVLSYAGLGISFYPYIVPRRADLREAAAPDVASASCSWARLCCADDPHLYRLRLLGVPRQGRPGEGYH